MDQFITSALSFGHVSGLDALFFSASLLTILLALTAPTPHERKAEIGVVIGALLLSFGMEFASIYFGGTHCHAAAAQDTPFKVTPCSSVNSLLFYVPWIATSSRAAGLLAKVSEKGVGRINLAGMFVISFLNLFLFLVC